MNESNEKIVYKGFVKVALLDKREVVQTTNSVNLFVFNKDTKKILLLREPRAGCISPENPEGLSVGTISGRFDVSLNVKQLMVKEAKEEAGVTADENQIILLNAGQPMTLSAGILTEKAYLGMITIDNSMIEQEERIFSAAEENEQIRRLYVAVEDLENYICEDVRVFAMIQFFLRTNKERA